MDVFQGKLVAAFLALATPVTAQEAVPDCGLYIYRAEIARVIDGDTVEANIDLGFNTWRHNEHLRLVGIDTPERGKPGATEATQALRDRIEGRTLYICTTKAKRSDKEATGSFHRYLVTIYDDGKSINEWLVNEGHAVRID
ncbi:thermonuclease family protein [Meridianimarinicoccus aquatilis]|uniref:Nuclease n=1 Tax=Meridianimarinicoccus aquatilis TaxID=2552766 RepID=A0A4R6AV90_9RHOB|nr:thermonuclease family protein [Fluviibacterium aquatile]TDL88027.1 nuclease [Fluviibacterium aquatile]